MSEDNSNFTITDSGTLLSGIDMDIDERRFSNVLAVRSEIADDPTLVARGTLSLTAAAAEDGIVSGDGTAANNIAGRFDTQLEFSTYGGIAERIQLYLDMHHKSFHCKLHSC